MTKPICSHCGRHVVGSAGMLLNGIQYDLCHPDFGLDCYRLVTIYRHQLVNCPCVKGDL